MDDLKMVHLLPKERRPFKYYDGVKKPYHLKNKKKKRFYLPWDQLPVALHERDPNFDANIESLKDKTDDDIYSSFFEEQLVPRLKMFKDRQRMTQKRPTVDGLNFGPLVCCEMVRPVEDIPKNSLQLHASAMDPCEYLYYSRRCAPAAIAPVEPNPQIVSILADSRQWPDLIPFPMQRDQGSIFDPGPSAPDGHPSVLKQSERVTSYENEIDAFENEIKDFSAEEINQLLVFKDGQNPELDLNGVVEPSVQNKTEFESTVYSIGGNNHLRTCELDQNQAFRNKAPFVHTVKNKPQFEPSGYLKTPETEISAKHEESSQLSDNIACLSTHERPHYNSQRTREWRNSEYYKRRPVESSSNPKRVGNKSNRCTEKQAENSQSQRLPPSVQTFFNGFITKNVASQCNKRRPFESRTNNLVQSGLQCPDRDLDRTENGAYSRKPRQYVTESYTRRSHDLTEDTCGLTYKGCGSDKVKSENLGLECIQKSDRRAGRKWKDRRQDTDATERKQTGSEVASCGFVSCGIKPISQETGHAPSKHSTLLDEPLNELNGTCERGRGRGRGRRLAMESTSVNPHKFSPSASSMSHDSSFNQCLNRESFLSDDFDPVNEGASPEHRYSSCKSPEAFSMDGFEPVTSTAFQTSSPDKSKPMSSTALLMNRYESYMSPKAASMDPAQPYLAPDVFTMMRYEPIFRPIGPYERSLTYNDSVNYTPPPNKPLKNETDSNDSPTLPRRKPCPKRPERPIYVVDQNLRDRIHKKVAAKSEPEEKLKARKDDGNIFAAEDIAPFPYDLNIHDAAGTAQYATVDTAQFQTVEDLQFSRADPLRFAKFGAVQTPAVDTVQFPTAEDLQFSPADLLRLANFDAVKTPTVGTVQFPTTHDLQVPTANSFALLPRPEADMALSAKYQTKLDEVTSVKTGLAAAFALINICDDPRKFLDAAYRIIDEASHPGTASAHSCCERQPQRCCSQNSNRLEGTRTLEAHGNESCGERIENLPPGFHCKPLRQPFMDSYFSSF